MRRTLASIALLFLFLSSPHPSRAEQYEKYSSVARDVSGNTVPGAQVTVFLGGTNTPATLYSNRSGTLQGNPFVTDSLGNYSFYAHPGRYKVVVNKVGVGTFTADDVAVGTQPHAETHVTGSTDPLNLSGIGGVLRDPQKVSVRTSGVSGVEPTIDLVPSPSIQFTVNDTGTALELSAGIVPGGVTSAALASSSVTPSAIAPASITAAQVSPSAAIPEGALALNFPTHSNANDPNAGQRAALAGSYGTPSGSNRYVTAADPANTDPRTPTIHAPTHSAAGSDPVSISASQVTDGTTTFAAKTHAPQHELGGADSIDVGGLPGLLAAPQRVAVEKDGGAPLGARPTLNFITGSGIALSISDNSVGNRVDVRLDATGGGGGGGSAVAVTDGTTTSSATDTVQVDPTSGLAVTNPTAGTAGIGFSDQAVGRVLAGPTSGSSTTPTFRALQASDLPASSTSQPGIVQLATSGGTTTGQAVQASDPRLADSRPPAGPAGGDLSGSFPNPTVGSVNPAAISAGTAGISITGNAGTASALAAAPTPCSVGQAGRGVDAAGNEQGCITPVTSVGVTAPVATTGGATPTLSVNAATTAAAGVVQLETGSTDTSSSHAVTANDTRLADSRTPTSHTHGAADVVSGTFALPLIPTIPLGTNTSGNYVSAVATTAPLTGGTAGTPTATLTLGVSNATTGAVGAVQLAGDLSGTATSPAAVGIHWAYVAKTASYTATATDSWIDCDAASGAVTVTLPTAVGITGKVYKVKKVDSSGNTCTIATTSAQTIDAASTVSLTAQFATKDLVSNGANWVADLPNRAIALFGTQGQCTAGQAPTGITNTGQASGCATYLQSVALATPSWLAVAGSPITTNTGTLTLSPASGQTAHQVLGTFSGSSVSLAALAAADLPPVTLGSGTTGNYVASTQTGLGLSGGGAGSAGAALTLTLDETRTLSSSPLAASQEVFGANGVFFEGSSSDANQTLLTVANPTADRTITLPDVSGNVVTTGDSATVTPAMQAVTSGQLVVGNGSNVGAGQTPSGDATMTNAGAFTVTGLRGRVVSSATPAANQDLGWDTVGSQLGYFTRTDYVVTRYGAACNGSTDDTSAFSTAIAAMPLGGELVIPGGATCVISSLTLSKAMTLRGSAGSTLKTNSATADMLTITAFGVTIRDLAFDATVTRTAGAYVKSGVGFTIEHFSMKDQFVGINVTNGATHWISNGSIRNGASGAGTAGIKIDNGSDTFIDHVTMDNPSPYPAAGIWITGTGDTNITDSDIIHCTDDLLVTGGFSIWAQSTFFDTATHGIHIRPDNPIGRVRFVGNWTSSHTGDGVWIEAGTSTAVDIAFSNHHAFFDGGSGFNIATGGGFTIANSQIQANAAAGITVAANVSDYSILGNTIGSTAASNGNAGNGTYGIVLAAGTSNSAVIADNRLTGNTSGTLSGTLSGSNDLICNNIPSSVNTCAGSGTVTSVGLSTTAGWMTVASSPITTSGTITMNPTSGQTANRVLASPDGTTGAVALRALVAADLPTTLLANGTDTVTVTTAPNLVLTNTDASTTGASMVFVKNRAGVAAANNDTNGTIRWQFSDTAPGNINGATIGATIIDTTTGAQKMDVDVSTRDGSGSLVKTATFSNTRDLLLQTTSGSLGFNASSPTGGVKWSGATGGTFDSGIVRSSAGILKVTNGSSGGGKLVVADGTNLVPSLAGTGSASNGVNFNGGTVIVTSGGNNATAFVSGSPETISGGQYSWSSSSSDAYANAADTGLARSAAGVVRITNGSTGVGSLKYGLSVAAKTADYTVLSTDTGTVFTNAGAGGQVVFTLPACTVGYTYKYVVAAAQNLRVLAVGSDKIYDGATASTAAGHIDSSTVGTRIDLVCAATNEWATLVNGTRTVT